ncbi:MAG: AAA family ATPase [Candidatus Andersenbacteria bacterium]
MARIVAIVNQKGGVGKTTTAINLGAYLAAGGLRVLLVDVDPQGNATSGLGLRPEQAKAGTYELMLGQTPLESIVVATPQQNLHLCPATPALAGANVELVEATQREFRLQQALSQAQLHYDVVLLDAPPSLGLVTINALTAADEVMIPVQSEYYALEGLSQLLHTIELVRSNIKPSLAILGAVITLHDKRTKLAVDVAREIRKFFPGRVFTTEIPRNVRLSEAPSYGKSILAYEPWSKGARAYRALAEEVRAAWASAASQQTHEAHQQTQVQPAEQTTTHSS